MLHVEFEKRAQLRTLLAIQLVASSRSLTEFVIADKLGSSSNTITKPSGRLLYEPELALLWNKTHKVTSGHQRSWRKSYTVCIYREPI